MNKWYGAAAALSSLLTAAHIFGGTPEFLTPITSSDLPVDIRAVAAIVWHGISVLLIVNSAVLTGAATGRSWGRGTGLVAAQYGGFVGLFLYFGLAFLGNITALLQWTAFGAIVGMIFLGSRAGRAVPPAQQP